MPDLGKRNSARIPPATLIFDIGGPRQVVVELIARSCAGPGWPR
jgi:hypothetical protein